MSDKMAGETQRARSGRGLADCEIETAEQEIREQLENQKI